MKVLFLDIDGVLQYSENRFQHSKEEIQNLCRDLTAKFEGVFDYEAWAGESSSNEFWTVAAVYWDWNPDAVKQLKRVLEATGAKIVLSSSWRCFGFKAMSALFRIWGLDAFYIDNTSVEAPGVSWIAKREVKRKLGRICNPDPTSFLSDRSLEIREWLNFHPEVSAYAVVDDVDIALGLEGHFVQTSARDCMTADVANKLISCLEKDGGPFLFPKEVKDIPEFATYLNDIVRKEEN